jgi:hypothetical protein
MILLTIDPLTAGIMNITRSVREYPDLVWTDNPLIHGHCVRRSGRGGTRKPSDLYWVCPLIITPSSIFCI